MSSIESVLLETVPEPAEVKICKEKRYYYRHREKILEKRRQKRLQDPTYQEKLRVREEKKKVKDEEKKIRDAKRENRIKTMTELSVTTSL